MPEILVAWGLGCVVGKENIRRKSSASIIGCDHIMFKTEKSR